MRHDPASGAVVIMLRTLKMHGMAQAVAELTEQSSPAFKAAVPKDVRRGALYSKVRMAVLRDGLSQRETARRFGIDRGAVSKMVGHAAPPGCRQAGARMRPRLDAHAGLIDEILRTDLTEPKKQRRTILRIFERLRDERRFDGGCTTVRDDVRPRRLSLKEVFVPLVHPAGHAQADFGEAWVAPGGVRRKVHVPVIDLPQSDAIFLKACLAETAEALCDGHVAASDSFGGAPLSILYDDARLAAAKILGDGTRERARPFWPAPIGWSGGNLSAWSACAEPEL